MASRKEEKERRRQERIAAEQAAKAAAARARRLRLFGAVGLAVVAVVAVVIAVVASGGKAGPGGPSKALLAKTGLPAWTDHDLTSAARKAGCVVLNYPKNYGPKGSSQSDPNNLYTHVGGTVNYKTNPPSFGNHNPTPASDGDYVGQGTPSKEHLVHALEHGRVEIQYAPGTPKRRTNQLEKLFEEPAGKFASEQYELLFQNETQMPYAVAAVAWVHILGCKTFNDNVFDAIRDFRAKWSFQGPEKQFVNPE